MIQLGKVQKLYVMRIKDFGVYLSEKDGDEAILLPKKQVSADTNVGDEIEVFVYRDSKDRLIATVNSPLICLGQLASLKVVDKNNVGVFLDWGLEKDLFLPFKEQTAPLKVGDKCFVSLYIDKSGRLCATMRVYDYLSNESPYKENDWIEGTVYQINPDIGVFVAVDNLYYGLIPKNELYDRYKAGDIIKARVVKVREDGKLDLSVREKSYIQMDTDAQTILDVIDEYDGVLPFGEKVPPEIIKREFHMSKNAFKRAVGKLLKEGKIELKINAIRRI